VNADGGIEEDLVYLTILRGNYDVLNAVVGGVIRGDCPDGREVRKRRMRDMDADGGAEEDFGDVTILRRDDDVLQIITRLSLERERRQAG